MEDRVYTAFDFSAFTTVDVTADNFATRHDFAAFLAGQEVIIYLPAPRDDWGFAYYDRVVPHLIQWDADPLDRTECLVPWHDAEIELAIAAWHDECA